MTRPNVVFHIANYHWETRTRRVTSKDANGNEQVRWESY